MNCVRLLGCFLGIAYSVFANAQWTVVNLHPVGAFQSYGYGASGNQQVGYAVFSGYTGAGLWTGIAGSWVYLSPQWANVAYGYGVGGGQQVGAVRVPNLDFHASLWNGTAGSWVDLNPAGASWSQANGANNGKQVGWATVTGVTHASLWSGTSTSRVDLNPAGSTYSEAFGVDDIQQVGRAVINGDHACLWTGTAASCVDLNPASGVYSWAYGVSGGQQVGRTYQGSGYYSNAALWTGTAASWINLNPVGSVDSVAYAVDSGQQVGYAYSQGNGYQPRASFWSGSPTSWVNLHAFLPAQFSESVARGISHVGAITYVVGYGYNTATQRNEALLWIYTPTVRIFPRVRIVGTPYIAKDSNGHFTIFVNTWHTVGTDNAQITMRLQGLANSSGTEISRTDSVQRTPQTHPWKFDLESLQVPRFTKPMNIRAIATIIDNGRPGMGASAPLPEIKLPVVVVRGIKPNPADPWEDSGFVNGLLAHGYARDTASYPTLFYLHYDPNGSGFDYDPTYEVLDRNAQCLSNLITYVTRLDSPVTYANSVDIVAHSKGGLVSRQYIKDGPFTIPPIRRLIMCCSPHLGSVDAWRLNFGLGSIAQLYPVYRWYRAAPGQLFFQLTSNPALADLNLNGTMPQSVEYHLLYGTVGAASTGVHYTESTQHVGLEDGDGYVLGWSATGYDIDVDINGDSHRGSRIPAFDSNLGARGPTSEVRLPFGHSGFLSNAVETIYQLLHAP